MKNALSRLVRALVLIALVCAGSARAHAQTLTPLYQYRYGDLQDFFITTNFNELGSGGGGWTYLGFLMYVDDSQAQGTVPLHRFYSPVNGTHFYSTDYNEVGAPVWTYEGVTGYIWPDQQSGTQPIRRWFKWVGNGPVHIYKFYNAAEDDYLASTGWTFEGIIGYAPPCTRNCY